MTNSPQPITILCLASYEKGTEFLRECKRQGCRVLLLTSQSIGLEPWPRASIDEIYLIPDDEKRWNLQHLIDSVSFLARTEQIDVIVPLDDFDLEKAAALREHLRIEGMGESATRFFRDKLAMRMRARECGITVPDFVHVLNYKKLDDFLSCVEPPWLLKPRFEASATGIKLLHSKEDCWAAIESLDNRQSLHLMEKFIPGDIYHVDSIVCSDEVIFAEAHKYGQPPFDVAHKGGIFTTTTVRRGSEDEKMLLADNQKVLRGMGLARGVSHTEFIKSYADGKFYFLETAARVGGAHIVELVEATAGINLWAEWAKIEISRRADDYQLPPIRRDYGGLIVSLARQEHPDTSAYKDPEIVWRLNKKSHAGLILKSPDPERVATLIEEYTGRFQQDFYATQPPPHRPVN